jgi:hypothetical protein
MVNGYPSIILCGMADPQVVSPLHRKRDDIQAAIESYEAKIEVAKHDLPPSTPRFA